MHFYIFSFSSSTVQIPQLSPLPPGRFVQIGVSSYLLPLYRTKAPINPRTPITIHIPLAPATCCVLAVPVNGAALVACTLFVDRVRLGSELNVAPCATDTDTVVIVKAGCTCVAVDEVFNDDVDVEAPLTMLAGGQLETLEPSADFAVEKELGVDHSAALYEDAVGTGKALEANESDERLIELE
jgi:hypothetical protein